MRVARCGVGETAGSHRKSFSEKLKTEKSEVEQLVVQLREQIHGLQEQWSLLTDLETEMDRCSALLAKRDASIEELRVQNAELCAMTQQNSDLTDLRTQLEEKEA
jgi:chromosome segregation ATPase